MTVASQPLWWGVPWPDALAAIGPFGAVSVALAGLVWQVRQGRVADRRKQAELVTAWVEYKCPPGGVDPMRAVVRNGSEACVFDVDFVGTENSRVEPQGLVTFPIVAPMSTTSVDGLADAYGESWEAERGVAIRFLDAGGRTWMRDEYGRLSEQKKFNWRSGS